MGASKLYGVPQVTVRRSPFTAGGFGVWRSLGAGVASDGAHHHPDAKPKSTPTLASSASYNWPKSPHFSRRRLTGLHNRGEHRLILYRLELKNLIIRDTSFMERILLDEFVDLAPSFYAGDDDSTGSRNLGAGDQELADLIRLIEKIATRLSNTFHFLDGNLVIQENEKHGKKNRSRLILRMKICEKVRLETGAGRGLAAFVIPRSFRKPLSLPTSSRDAGANQTR